MRSGATRKRKNITFDKEKLPGALTGVSNSNVGLCLHNGTRDNRDKGQGNIHKGHNKT